MLSLFQSLPDVLRIVTSCLLLFVGAGLCGYSRHYRFLVEERVRRGRLSRNDAGRASAFRPPAEVGVRKIHFVDQALVADDVDAALSIRGKRHHTLWRERDL